MTTTEALLGELATEVRASATGYAKIEVKLDGISDDIIEVKDQLKILSRIQSDHSERLTMNEAKLMELQHLRTEVLELKGDLRELRATVAANAPQKTPWTAVMSAIVALGALAWALFGK